MCVVVVVIVDMFGGIDIFVNNVSVIWLCGMLEILMKWFDLM